MAFTETNSIGAEKMPTKVFYSMGNEFITEMLHPKKAWKTLEKHGRPNFNDFIMKIEYLQSTRNVEMYGLKLGGKDWGGVIMCGKTEELEASFKGFWKISKGIRVFIFENKEKEDPLLVYFVRGKTTFGEPETMIAIGCQMKWWGCIPPVDDPDTYKPGDWIKYPAFKAATPDISFKELANGLDDCEKDENGKTIKAISW
jgi:hypothetical protein